MKSSPSSLGEGDRPRSGWWRGSKVVQTLIVMPARVPSITDLWSAVPLPETSSGRMFSF